MPPTLLVIGHGRIARLALAGVSSGTTAPQLDHLRNWDKRDMAIFMRVIGAPLSDLDWDRSPANWDRCPAYHSVPASFLNWDAQNPCHHCDVPVVPLHGQE